MAKKTTETEFKSWKAKLHLALIAASALLIILAVFAYIAVRNERESRSASSVEKFINKTPKFVFKKIKFCKYVAYGKPDGTGEWTNKLDIFHISGTAELYIDLKDNLKCDSVRTNYAEKKLYLVYTSKSIPFEIDIDIPTSDVVNVETIEPRRLDSTETKAAAEKVSVVTEVIGEVTGGYLGFKLGSAAGETLGDAVSKIPHPIFKIASGGFGQIVGSGIGIALGTKYGGEIGKETGYLLTENLLTDFHIADGHSKADNEMILRNAKQLIAIELAGGNRFEDTDFTKSMRQYYEEECKKNIVTAMKNFGWEEVIVEFKYEE